MPTGRFVEVAHVCLDWQAIHLNQVLDVVRHLVNKNNLTALYAEYKLGVCRGWIQSILQLENVLLLLTFCLLLLPLWKSLTVLCFVVRYFMSILVLQSSWWGRESWLLCLICLPGVSWWVSGSSSRCHGVVCGLWVWYFLIILTYYFWLYLRLLEPESVGWASLWTIAKVPSPCEHRCWWVVKNKQPNNHWLWALIRNINLYRIYLGKPTVKYMIKLTKWYSFMWSVHIHSIHTRTLFHKISYQQ